MGVAPCDLLECELALDRLEAELAAEMPAHVRAYARAHADDTPPPPAPRAARLASSLATGRAALVHPLLADRGLALVRLIAPLVIEEDPAVTDARRADPTWNALAVLAQARDEAARAEFGFGFVELMQRLHGAAVLELPAVPEEPWPPRIVRWNERDATGEAASPEHVWRLLADRHGVTGVVRFLHSDIAKPRAFVVEPGREVIVVFSSVVDAPATRFAALHELGHAVAALAAPAGLPRVLDEAAAAYIARLMETSDQLPLGWASPLAVTARRRRAAVASGLDALERTLPRIAEFPTERPPWALWHDPGAQASYVAAEILADRWWRELGPTPGPDALARVLAEERARIDRATRL